MGKTSGHPLAPRPNASGKSVHTTAWQAQAAYESSRCAQSPNWRFVSHHRSLRDRHTATPRYRLDQYETAVLQSTRFVPGKKERHRLRLSSDHSVSQPLPLRYRFPGAAGPVSSGRPVSLDAGTSHTTVCATRQLCSAPAKCHANRPSRNRLQVRSKSPRVFATAPATGTETLSVTTRQSAGTSPHQGHCPGRLIHPRAERLTSHCSDPALLRSRQRGRKAV